MGSPQILWRRKRRTHTQQRQATGQTSLSLVIHLPPVEHTEKPSLLIVLYARNRGDGFRKVNECNWTQNCAELEKNITSSFWSQLQASTLIKWVCKTGINNDRRRERANESQLKLIHQLLLFTVGWIQTELLKDETKNRWNKLARWIEFYRKMSTITNAVFIHTMIYLSSSILVLPYTKEQPLHPSHLTLPSQLHISTIPHTHLIFTLISVSQPSPPINLLVPNESLHRNWIIQQIPDE